MLSYSIRFASLCRASLQSESTRLVLVSTETPSNSHPSPTRVTPAFPDVSIRTATKDDVYAIVALLADDDIAASREELTDPLPQVYWDAFEAIEADPQTSLLVAVTPKEEVLATLQLTYLPGLSRRGALRAVIEAVRVAKKTRGLGLGTGLLKYAIAEAQRQGASLIQLTTDARRADSQRFYKRLGFAETHAGMRLFLTP